MAKRKWWLSLLGVTSAACLGTGIVMSLPTNEASAQENATVITEFSAATDPTISKFMVGVHDRSAYLDTTLAMFLGEDPTFHEWYPDWTFLTYKTGVDTTTNVGVAGEDYLKIGLVPQYAGQTTSTTFNFTGVDADQISKVIVRAYIQLNATETSNTTITFASLDGTGSFVYNTYGNEGKWIDIEIAASNLEQVISGDTFSGFTMSIANAQGSGCYTTFSNPWHNFTAAPCYVMLDSISYSSEAVQEYKVTYNYGGKLENTVEAVNAAPYKATKPADPVVAGYDFVGWYTDEACTTAYDFDNVVGADITLYAKWTEVALAEGVLSNFAMNTAQVANIGVTLYDASNNPVPMQDITNYNLAEALGSWGPASGTSFDVIDATALAGSKDGKVLQINSLSPEYWGASNFGTKVLIAKKVNAAEVGSLTIRMYLSLDKTLTSGELTKLFLYNFAGTSFVEVDTSVQYQWIDVTLTSEDVAKLSNDGVFEGFIIRALGNITTTNNGNTATFSSAYWPECATSIEPLFIAIDEVSYTKEIVEVATYNVTYNYGGKLENVIQEVKGAPYKATKPANPVVSGYNFVGWYTDEACTIAYDFDNVVSADITLYAKWTEVVVADGVLSQFAGNDVTINKFMLGVNDWSADPVGTKIDVYSGGGWEANFPDSTFLNYKTGTDALTGVGEGDYLKIALAPTTFTGGNAEVGFTFLKGIESEKIGSITIRVYSNLNANEYTKLAFVSADGAGVVEYLVFGNEGKWIDIVLTGDDAMKLANSETFGGFSLKIINASGSGMYNSVHNDWWNFDAEPCYLMLDSITYMEKAEEYTVTFDYQGKAENSTQTLMAAPYKATKPADIVIAGYSFGGWYTDEACTAAFDFETEVTADITLYAKWTEVVAADGVISDFASNDITVNKLVVGANDWSADPLGAKIDLYAGPGWEVDFPDVNLLKYKNGLDAASGVGEGVNNYLKISLAPGTFTGGNAEVGFTFLKGIESAKIGSITIRLYLQLNASEVTKLAFVSADGAGVVEYSVFGNEGKWIDLVLTGGDVMKLANSETFQGFTLRILEARGSGMYTSLHNDWWNFDAQPCYVMLDSISYMEKAEEYTVTFDYQGKAENTTQTLMAPPYKAIAPTENPAISGYTFEGWYVDAECTTAWDFETEISEDVTLYAKWTEVVLEEGCIADMSKPSIMLGTADIGRESYNEWANFSVQWGATFPEFGTQWVSNVEGSEDGNVLQINAIGFNLTPAIGFGLTFAAPLNVEEIGSITLRMYMHLDTAGDSVFRVYADNDEHFDFTSEIQDEWVDIVITKADLDRIVSGKQLSKLSFVLTFGSIHLGSIAPGYSAYWDVTYEAEPAWAWIDTITYADATKVTFIDGDNTTVVIAAKGSPVEAPQIYVPAGKVFLGWYNGETLFDITSAIEGDLTLTAKYGDEIADYSTVVGVYTANGASVILNTDKTVFVIIDGQVVEGTYVGASTGAMVATFENATEYFTCIDGKVLFDSYELVKGEAVTVTYKLLNETREILCLSGGIALDLAYVEPGYAMLGWYADGATEAYAFDTPITENLILTAKLEKVEIEDYTEYLGTYYNANSGEMIVLEAENKATVVLNGTVKEATYWLLADGIGVYAIDGVETVFEYLAAKVFLDGKELKILKNYSVAFKADGKTLSVIYVNSGLYKAVKPEDPVKEGYTFVGWFESGAKEAFNFDSVVTKNTVLTAKFEKVAGEKKKGCGSSISAISSVVLVSTTLIGAAAILRKKED